MLTATISNVSFALDRPFCLQDREITTPVRSSSNVNDRIAKLIVLDAFKLIPRHGRRSHGSVDHLRAICASASRDTSVPQHGQRIPSCQSQALEGHGYGSYQRNYSRKLQRDHDSRSDRHVQ